MSRSLQRVRVASRRDSAFTSPLATTTRHSRKVISHGGCFLRVAVETRAGQGDPRRVRAGARSERRRPSEHRGGRRRRGQLDADRVVRQETSRPVLQHRDRREQSRRDRGRSGLVGQDQRDRQLRGVHHVQRLRSAPHVGGLSAPERQGRRQPRGHLDRRGRGFADGDRGRFAGLLAARLRGHRPGRRGIDQSGDERDARLRRAGLPPGRTSRSAEDLHRRLDPVPDRRRQSSSARVPT